MPHTPGRPEVVSPKDPIQKHCGFLGPPGKRGVLRRRGEPPVAEHRWDNGAYLGCWRESYFFPLPSLENYPFLTEHRSKCYSDYNSREREEFWDLSSEHIWRTREGVPGMPIKSEQRGSNAKFKYSSALSLLGFCLSPLANKSGGQERQFLSVMNSLLGPWSAILSVYLSLLSSAR